MPVLVIILIAAIGAPAGQSSEAPARRTERVVLVTLDGVRTEEMFGGLDLDILRSVAKDGKAEDTPTYRTYWAPTPEERRRRVMPFLWGTLATAEGSIGGNRARGSTVQLSNTRWFSYPGYAEIVTGQAHDDTITSNDNRRYPFPSVFEFLRERLQVTRDEVAVFASWETFNWIAEHREGSVAINAGYEAYDHPDAAVRQVSDLQFAVRPGWETARYDAFTFRLAMAHLATHRPRALHIAFDETDDWAHDRRYDRVLESLTIADGFLRELWTWLQAQPDYRGRTALLITTDHGRGTTAADWSKHGESVPAAAFTWLVAAGPDWPRRGEWRDVPAARADQVASTLARVLGLDFRAAVPTAGHPLDLLWTR